MRTGTVSYRMEDLKNRVIIPIGFVGENDFTRVIFDAEEIYKKFPNASVSMKVQPPKGGIYPATVTRDGNTVIWQVKEADVANRGGGELQLTFTDGETKIKTYIAKTDVKRSLEGNGPAPDPVQDWIDDAEEVLDDLAAMDNIAKTALEGDIGKALSPKTVENGVVTEWQFVEPGAGTDDYTDLDNKPQIAGVTLSGNKTLEDLGIASEESLGELSEEVTNVKTAIQGITPNAQQSDIGKAIILKTIDQTGKPTAFEYGEAGGVDPSDFEELENKVDAIAEVKPAEDVDILDYQLDKYYFWGNGGKINVADPGAGYEAYFAVSTLIPIIPGSTIILKNIGYKPGANSACIGLYDSNGLDAPGRVNFSNTTYVESYTVDENNFVSYAKIIAGETSTRMGIFFVIKTGESINNLPYNPTYKLENAQIDFTEDAKREIGLIVDETLNGKTMEAEDIRADYYNKGAAKKTERTKKLCIIGAGQSNILGVCPVSSLPSGVSLPMSGINYIKNDLTGVFGSAIPSDNWGFDVITCHYLLNNLGANNLYYIKWAVGATAIDPSAETPNGFWTADYESISNLDKSLLLKFNKEIGKCGEVNSGDYEIGAMIWHQGEGDYATGSPTASANYYRNFKKVISYCRGIVGNANLPFICGTISHNSAQYDATIEGAILQLASEDPYMWVVDMSDAVLMDQYHFNAAWSEYFGEKVYDCLIDAKVITGTKLNPSKPT